MEALQGTYPTYSPVMALLYFSEYKYPFIRFTLEYKKVCTRVFIIIRDEGKWVVGMRIGYITNYIEYIVK